jgi:hypothetical protein
MRTGSRGKGSTRSSKLIECKKHGLVYDVTVATGCVLCLRERKQYAMKSTAGSKLTVAALAIIAAAAIAYILFFGRGENEEPLVSVSRAAVHPAMSAEEERERQEKAALAISNLLDDLTRLVDNAEIRMENLGEAGVNLTNIDEGENQMRLNTWRYWAEEWIKEVDAFKGGILDKKVYITPKQSKALSTAKLAIRRMKLVPNIGPGVSLKPGEEGYTDHYLPSEHVRKGWLGEIRKLIERSRTQLEKAV